MLINWFWISGDVYMAFLAPLWRWSLKIVSPAEIRKLSKAQKLPWFVLAASTPSISVPLSRWPRRAMFCRPHKTIISVIEQSFYLLFWIFSLAPSLSWINTLSRLPLILSTKASQTAMATLWYTLAALRSHISYIFLKLVNALSTSTPLPFHTTMLLAKSTQGSTHHFLANCKSTSCHSSNTDVESHNHLHMETCNQYQEWSGNCRSCTFHVWSINFFSWPSKLHLY